MCLDPSRRPDPKDPGIRSHGADRAHRMSQVMRLLGSASSPAPRPALCRQIRDSFMMTAFRVVSPRDGSLCELGIPPASTIAMKPVVTIPMTGATENRDGKSRRIGACGHLGPEYRRGRHCCPHRGRPPARPRGNVRFVAPSDGGSGQYVRRRHAGVEPNRERSDWNVLLVASTYEVWREEGYRDGGGPNACERDRCWMDRVSALTSLRWCLRMLGLSS